MLKYGAVIELRAATDSSPRAARGPVRASEPAGDPRGPSIKRGLRARREPLKI
jgi:hypothetical protein